METESTKVMSIRRQNDIEKSTWGTHRYFVDLESRIRVELYRLLAILKLIIIPEPYFSFNIITCNNFPLTCNT